jgi:putative Holliday junction resolvase
MRYLAIDYGTKQVGLAICDAGETVASPLAVVRNESRLIERIADVVRTQNVEAVVVGLPLNMDGSKGAQAKVVLKFASELEEYLGIPIELQDERLTSFSAEHKLAPADLSRGKKRKRIDAVAAAAILEAFLEAKEAK